MNLLNRYGFDNEVTSRETSVDIRNALEKNTCESIFGLESGRDPKAQKTGLEDATLYPENEINRDNLVDTGNILIQILSVRFSQ